LKDLPESAFNGGKSLRRRGFSIRRGIAATLPPAATLAVKAL
jgi:hypothetical protein